MKPILHWLLIDFSARDGDVIVTLTGNGDTEHVTAIQGSVAPVLPSVIPALRPSVLR